MTPDWLQPMPWLQMEQERERRPSTGEGILSAASTLGSAIFRPPDDPMQQRKPQLLDLLRGSGSQGGLGSRSSGYM
jgi:hypothetical protein